MSDALEEAGRLEEVLRSIREAVCLEPDNVMYLVNFGTTLCRSGRPLEGVVAYLRALELAPDDVDARYNLAVGYEEAGRTHEADLV